MAQEYFDFTTASIRVYDPAGRKMLGYTNDFGISLNYFIEQQRVIERADKILKEAAYPVATFSLKTNREMFKFQPGDLFKFSYTPWNISEMVVRVMSIQEEEFGSEEITVVAVEDVNYTTGSSQVYSIEKPTSQVDPYPPLLTGKITNFNIIEAPYILAGGEKFAMIPVAGKVTGQESSYFVYESVDGGLSYSKICESNFNNYGSLAESYPDTPSIDDDVGILVEFSVDEELPFYTLSRSSIYGTANLAIIDKEFVSFQTVTLVSGTTYRLSNVNRGLLGSLKVPHPINSDFYFIGDAVRTVHFFNTSVAGSTRRYKFVPISGEYTGSIDTTTDYREITYQGLAFCPYDPANLKANDRQSNAIYGPYIDPPGSGSFNDIALTWYAAVRDEGAGTGIADYTVDYGYSWEGYFRIYVFPHDNLGDLLTDPIRIVEGIDALTWIYTEEMNLADNTTLANFVTFVMHNYITDPGGAEYKSNDLMITVRKDSTVIITSTSTTTSSSSTTTTTTPP